MSITRLTKQRLYQDEATFNKLLPYVKWDSEHQVFVHGDASIWSMWYLKPVLLTSISDAAAFQTCAGIQELVDSMDNRISVQFSWITTFDIQDILDECLYDYPLSGVAGWMARRWVRLIKNMSKSEQYERRCKRLRLVVCFRYDPPWKDQNPFDNLSDTFRTLLGGPRNPEYNSDRIEEYKRYVEKFRGEVEGKVARLSDLGLYPSRIDGQGLINLLYPLLNRRSVKGGKFKRGRFNACAVPQYDPDDILSNQISDTMVYHPEDGFILKDGRVYHTISMVKPPKQALPLMTVPVQSLPMESVFTVTYSKDSQEEQMKRLDRLDQTLGLREIGARGRANQKVLHQINTIRKAREELYSNRSQVVRVGVHHMQITNNIDEARRASSEVLAMFPALNGARAMAHMISDLGVFLNALPGAYDPTTDGPGWTSMVTSSRAVRLFPVWGNWSGSENSLFVLPSLWNRELVSFDLFDSNVAPNVIVSGVSGAGKSYLLCFLLITLNRGHYAEKPDGSKEAREPITFIFDKGMPNLPCGFERVAKLFGGRIYQATPARAPAMNFLARLGEMDPDRTNEEFKDLFDICVDIIADMACEKDKTLSRIQRNELIECLLESHYRYRHGDREREFLLRDVVKVLKEPPRPSETEQHFHMRQELAILMREYYGDGTYARFFDRAGRLELKERFIVFDLKGLSRNPDLQRVFLKVAMIWADEVMNTPHELDTRKLLVFDEAHDLIGKTAAGVVEAAFRLYRKRKGIVIAASQSGEDFYAGEGGQAIVQNSSHKIFLRQDPSKFHVTAQAFNLNPQQAETITRLHTIKGVESQFFLLSDIGEAAMVLPAEPSFYWVSTNNGDDNQLFSALLEESDGDFVAALKRAVEIAPFGAKDLMKRRKMLEEYYQRMKEESDNAIPMSGGRALNLKSGLKTA
ncbi:MAG TPA: TraC family protein [Oligoflexia bacterium]|nr:TraC family protein [Oligoflexia bacterium]HMP49615.1 TraC family protein [Oligoflexia bacterium]